jgi:hypothetical protein
VSIVATLTFHYIAYFSIIFRAQRIINVIELEKKYLDQIYKINPSVEEIENGLLATLTNGSVSDISDVSKSQKSGVSKSKKGEDGTQKVLTAKQFQKKLERQEAKKTQQLENCRENFYIIQILKIISGFSVIGVVCFVFIGSLGFILPIYRSDFCSYVSLA